MKKKIGIIGCGNMGAALIKGVTRSQGHKVTSYDVDKRKAKEVAKKYKTKLASSSAELVSKCDVIVLAVKPQHMDEVLNQIRYQANPYKLLISVAAGVSTSRIEKKIGNKVAVIRAMPNMPAFVGAGVTAICKGKFATTKDLSVANKIFSSVGEVVDVKENLMAAVTAISGSGPAYFFHLVEVLMKMGCELGLKETIAKQLAVETALGSAKILKETKEHPQILRTRVTSKGGATEAAFEEFYKHDLEIILKRGIRKAFERTKCL